MAFALIAVLASILFVRLGFWQLDRHEQKRTAVELREMRLAEDPVSIATLLEGEEPGAGDENIEWRRVRLRGRWDVQNEILIRNRAHNGRPGVHIVTPLTLTGGGAASDVEIAAKLLVLRGWLPAPDAMTPGAIAPPEDADTAGGELVGVIRTSRAGAGEPILPSGEGAERRPSFAAVDVEAIEAHTRDSTAYLPVFVQLLPGESTVGIQPAAGEPIPVPLPEPGSGPHLTYAIQWFSFAVIALVGTGAYLFHPRRRIRSRAVRGDPSPG